MNNPEFACEICGLYFDKYDIDVHQSICNHDSQVKFKRATPKEVLAFFDLKPDFKCSVQEISDLAEALREALRQCDSLTTECQSLRINAKWSTKEVVKYADEVTVGLQSQLTTVTKGWGELKIQLIEMNKKYDKALIRIKDIEAIMINTHLDDEDCYHYEQQKNEAAYHAMSHARDDWRQKAELANSQVAVLAEIAQELCAYSTKYLEGVRSEERWAIDGSVVTESPFVTRFREALATLDPAVEREALKAERDSAMKEKEHLRLELVKEQERRRQVGARVVVLQEAAKHFTDDRYCSGFPDCEQHKLKKVFLDLDPSAQRLLRRLETAEHALKAGASVLTEQGVAESLSCFVMGVEFIDRVEVWQKVRGET